MLRVNIYLTDELNKEIEQRSRVTKKSKAEIVRQALEKGLIETKEKSLSAKALINLAHLAEQVPTKGKLPKDLIPNMDFYTWGGKKRG